MPAYTTDDIRNIAFIGHGGTGKTTLVEALLHKTGAIPVMGEVTRGTTVCDFDAQEKAHQHSLYAAVASLDHQGVHINLLDTPGYPDFLGRSLSVLPAVETAAIVIDARAGVDLSARRMMDVARQRRLCRMVVVNKVDADALDFAALMEELREAFGAECLPLNLPADGGSKVVDCFFARTGGPTDIYTVEQAHEQIIDQVVELDEELMELYLEQGEELAPDRLHDAFEKALREGHLIPVCFVSATAGTGVAELLRVFSRLMPNPREGNPPPFRRGQGSKAEAFAVSPDAQLHVVAHVYKIAIDAFTGRTGVFRIHQGTVRKDSQLLVGDARKPFKVAHLYRPQGKEQIEIAEGIPGDICVLAKVEDLHYDAVLHDSHDEDGLHLKSIELPEPMYGLAILARNRGDEQKLSDALHKLAAEDPCLRVEHSAVLNETVMRGLGELHLRMTLERMRERHGVDVETRLPRIAYRETVQAAAEGHHRHKKQTGGAGQFGEVYLRVEPMERGAGFEFVDGVVGGVIPHQFIPAVEKGVRQILEQGAVAGYPLGDVRVTVFDGKHHPVDSKEVAFITAGKRAFLDAISKARPLVLEPVVDIQVTVPQANLGDVTGDLASRRGRINGTNALAGGMAVVSGQAPQSELASYQSHLKSVTAGAGTYTMNFSHYDPVPASVQQQLTAEFRGHGDED